MFIGIGKELDVMQSLYDIDGFGRMVIYGRRRIGKSTLINEFIKNKNAIFYTATKVGKNRNLESEKSSFCGRCDLTSNSNLNH